MQELQERLELTEEQREQVRSVLTDHFEAVLTVLDQHGIDLEEERSERERLGLKKLRALRKDLDQVRKATREQLANVLSPEQLAEYKQVRTEQRERIRKKIREKSQD